MALWQHAQPAVVDQISRDGAFGRGLENEIRILGEERIDLGVVFLGLERARAVDEEPILLHYGCGGAQDLFLQRRHHCQIRDLDPPACIGVPSESTGAGAGNIDQHDIDRPDGRVPGVANEGQEIGVLQSPLIRQQPLQPHERFVARHYTAGGARELQRLATGGSAQVSDCRSHGYGSVFRDQCCRRILNKEEAFLECAELGERRPA